MPTYQYVCTACDNRLEVVQKFSDDPMTECASCGGRLRKVFSAVGVVFKGSGFYRTDSRAASASNGTSGSQDNKADANGGKSAESSSSSGESSTSSGSSDSSSSSSGSSSSSSNGSGSSGGSTETGKKTSGKAA